MSDRARIRFMSEGEEHEVCALIARVFDEYVAGDFSTEGVKEFYRYAEPAAMAERMGKGHKILLAVDGGRILGMLELKAPDHIAMLFVYDRGRGMGRALVEKALQICREGTAGLEKVSVHASRYAVPIYRKLGFEAEGSERTENGITYIPMTIRFETDG